MKYKTYLQYSQHMVGPIHSNPVQVEHMLEEAQHAMVLLVVCMVVEVHQEPYNEKLSKLYDIPITLLEKIVIAEW